MNTQDRAVKQCPRCGEVKLLTAEFWYFQKWTRKKARDEYDDREEARPAAYCKTCDREIKTLQRLAEHLQRKLHPRRCGSCDCDLSHRVDRDGICADCVALLDEHDWGLENLQRAYINAVKEINAEAAAIRLHPPGLRRTRHSGNEMVEFAWKPHPLCVQETEMLRRALRFLKMKAAQTRDNLVPSS